MNKKTGTAKGKRGSPTRGRVIKVAIPQKKSVFINPFTDFSFKRIFGSVHNKELTIDFLNALLKGYLHITDIIFISNERSGRTRSTRKVVFDITVETTDGRYVIIIEMQYASQNFIKKRDLYYAASSVQEQLPPGSKDFNIKKTITVCITNFCFDNEHPLQVLHPVLRIDEATGKEFDDYLRSFYVELPKFKKTESELGDDRLSRWLYALKRMPELMEIPVTLQGDPIFEKLFEVARLSNLNKDDMTAHQYEDKIQRDYYHGLSVAKEEGEVIGLRKGEARGIRKAEVRRRKDKIETVERMLRDRMRVENVSKYTGLPIGQIRKLAQKINGEA